MEFGNNTHKKKTEKKISVHGIIHILNSTLIFFGNAHFPFIFFNAYKESIDKRFKCKLHPI